MTLLGFQTYHSWNYQGASGAFHFSGTGMVILCPPDFPAQDKINDVHEQAPDNPSDFRIDVVSPVSVQVYDADNSIVAWLKFKEPLTVFEMLNVTTWIKRQLWA